MENQPDYHTILVVEDCEPDIDALLACLGRDYKVRVTMDGESALETIKADIPDLILLDILMPGMDGFEVCRQIKEDPASKDIPVIFVTSLTEIVDETRGLEMGAVDYITKPFNFAVIRAKVKIHLDLLQARTALENQNRILKENIRLREEVEQIYRHDLKTPIQAILGAAQLMEEDTECSPERQKKLLQHQINACYTMMEMINRTMVLYKMEQGTCPLLIKQVDIMPLLDRIAKGFCHQLQTKDIRLEIILNGSPASLLDPCTMACDEILFYIMMGNLIKNAIEASPAGAPIAVRIQDRADQTKIEVENQGAVPLVIRDRLFEKFSTHGKAGGTGLGTYSARLMAKLHGGDINFSVPSGMDKTIVSIWLPHQPSSPGHEQSLP